MNEPVRVVQVTPAEIDALIDSVVKLFRDDAGVHDALIDIGWPKRQGASRYGALVGDESWLLLLAKDGDAPIGHLVGKLIGPSATRPATIADVESVYVDESHRRSGIARRLISAFLDWAAASGAAEALVTAYSGNSNARGLYQSTGFDIKSVTFSLPLTRD